jgi:hypothetical protein
MSLKIKNHTIARTFTTIALLLALYVTGRKAFWQSPQEVFIREPGHRLLEGPQPVSAEAKKHWQFAWLSVAAYRRAPNSTAPGEADIADAALQKAGWVQWRDFPDAGLAARIRRSHLRVEVWENKSAKSVAVTFGGTVADNWRDWIANLRWIIPFHNDEYTKVVKDFCPAFVCALLKRISVSEDQNLDSFILYSTGHSLGGGLAQQFAYALPVPVNARIPRVSHVFAFDPSPVTGFYSVSKLTRDENKTGLKIDRIYQRGEALAPLRSLTSLFVPPSRRDPEIIGVRYNLFYSIVLIAAHNMRKLAENLQSKSAQPSG